MTEFLKKIETGIEDLKIKVDEKLHHKEESKADADGGECSKEEAAKPSDEQKEEQKDEQKEEQKDEKKDEAKDEDLKGQKDCDKKE